MNEALTRALDPRSIQKVLDVACGSGNGVLVAGTQFIENKQLEMYIYARSSIRWIFSGTIAAPR